MKSILVGSVGSTKQTLECMCETGFPISKVFGLDREVSGNVSGYEPIHELAEEKGIPFSTFTKINDKEVIREIESESPDYIFVIGLSQIVSEELRNCAKKGVIGFHPTPLPAYRGRAPLVWQVLLGVKETKVSLFFIDGGVDSGDIIGQESYTIEEDDYAMDVRRKCNQALGRLLKEILPKIKKGDIVPSKQNEQEATYLLKRSPEDGRIDWESPAAEIHRLIRAVSRPYPGAFAHYKGASKVIFWKAELVRNHPYIGIPGQIAKVTKDYLDIVTTEGLLRVTEYEVEEDVKFVAGNKFK